MANKRATPRRWLLLRGLARENRHWGDFSKKLKKAFPKDEIVLLDLPGAGTEYLGKCPWTMSGIRRDIRHRWLALGKPQNDDVILGISLGGMITLDWIAHHPKDFKAAIVINSSAFGLCFPWERLRPWAMAQVLKIAQIKNLVKRERAIAEMTNARSVGREEIALRASYEKECPISIRNSLAQLLAAAAFRAPSKKPKAELLFLRSLEDRLCNPVCSERLANRYGAPLESHPTAGHELPVDDPTWVIDRLIENFSK